MMAFRWGLLILTTALRGSAEDDQCPHRSHRKGHRSGHGIAISREQWFTCGSSFSSNTHSDHPIPRRDARPFGFVLSQGLGALSMSLPSASVAVNAQLSERLTL